MIRLSQFLGAFVIASALIFAPTASFAGVFIGIGISVNTAPPVLPVYYQPPCPQANLIWTPGYWAYAEDGGYYWVPGAWVAAPEPGYLWTPGYWGYGGGLYAWHAGYWGPHVGFYGGVNYGYGYFGSGFYGGAWRGGYFQYNTAYANVNRTVINNVYVNRTVINNYNVQNTRVSYNGGPHGIQAQPNARELSYENERHIEATSFQQRAIERAAQNRSAFATTNRSYAHPSYAHPSGAAERADPFSRFDRTPESTTYRAPHTYNAQNAYHPAAAYHENAAYRPQHTYGSEHTYGSQNAYRPQHAYHSPRAYHPYGEAARPHGAPSEHESSHRER